MHAPWNALLRPKTMIVWAAVVTLAGVGAFALNRDSGRGGATPTALRPAVPPRPPLSASEQEYIRALWPIHGDVERSAMRMSLGQIFYKTQDLERAELGTRVDEALAMFQAAEKRLATLQPPPSLRDDHEAYLAAVRLFKESALEVRRMFSDGNDDHMLAAYPKSQAGSDRIRDVGGKFWPHEFPPH